MHWYRHLLLQAPTTADLPYRPDPPLHISSYQLAECHKEPCPLAESFSVCFHRNLLMSVLLLLYLLKSLLWYLIFHTLLWTMVLLNLSFHITFFWDWLLPLTELFCATNRAPHSYSSLCCSFFFFKAPIRYRSPRK